MVFEEEDDAYRYLPPLKKEHPVKDLIVDEYDVDQGDCFIIVLNNSTYLVLGWYASFMNGIILLNLWYNR